MTNYIIGYFCETGWTMAADSHFNAISSKIADTTTILSYASSQTRGSALFAYGVEEAADHFIADLKNSDLTDKVQLNFIAHSRGVISALIAIKKIQSDPDLRDKICLTADFHDPVPGNFQLTTNVAGNWAVTNQAYDLSDCEWVKKVHITLQEKPFSRLAFDALIPQFHSHTEVEIEALPGYHDVQHRNSFHQYEEHKALFEVGLYKSLEILEQDGHQFQDDERIETQENQILAYNELLPWINTRETAFAQRALHFGGKITANNQSRSLVDAVNWRHAKLLETLPEHVLFGTNQANYNYRKSLLEHYCDLSLTLDLFLARHPSKEDLVRELRQLAQEFYNDSNSRENYREQCQNLLNRASIRSKSLNKVINALSLEFLFTEMDQAIKANVPEGTLLYNNLQNLQESLIRELSSEIQSGKSIADIDNSYPIKVAKNTAIFVKDLYPDKHDNSASEIIRLAGQYALDNMGFGKNWSAGQKVIATLVVSLAATVVGCVLGAIIGTALGLTIAPFIGPGALITAPVGAFIGALKGAIIASATVGSAVGVTSGLIGSHYFFKPSALERKIHILVDDLKSNVKESDEDDPRLELLLH